MTPPPEPAPSRAPAAARPRRGLRERPSRRLRGGLPLLLGALGLCASCGGAAEEASGVRRQTLVLQSTDVEAERPESSKVASLTVPEQLEGWQIEQGAAEIVSTSEEPDRRGLLLEGKEHTLISIPLPPDTGHFNRIAVTVRSHSPRSRRGLRLNLLMEAGRIVVGEGKLPDLSQEPQTLFYDFPHTRFLDEGPRRVHLRTFGPRGDLIVEQIELIDSPLSRWLPDPHQGSDLVTIEGEARRAVGLSDRRPIETEVEVPRGARLAFAYGIPKPLRLPGSKPRLRLLIQPQDGPGRSVEYPLPRAAGDDTGWREAEVSLRSLVGRKVRLRFELQGAGEREKLCAIAEPALLLPAAAPRTVLFVTSDTHRADHLGAARSQIVVRTPALDALADRGLLFETCFATTNVTVPSHVSLMTGTHPRDTRIISNEHALSSEARTLAEHFQEEGYSTWALVSASLLSHAHCGIGQGFDRMSVPVGAQRVADETISVLERWLEGSADQSLFVWLHLYDAHSPYGPPEPFAGRYYPEGQDPCDPSLPALELPSRVLPPNLPGLRDLGFPAAEYRAEVDYLDSQLARVLQHPRLRDGVIAVTADHGECLGQHGLYFCHGELYPDTVHVPLILAFPGAPAGTRVKRLVGHLDLGRTLLDLAGLHRARFAGRNLLRALERADEPERPHFAVSMFALSASLTQGDWHLILHLRDHMRQQSVSPKKRHQVELYDLAADPGCLTDLSEEEHKRTRGMRLALVGWLNSADDRGWMTEGQTSETLFEDLAALGYADMAGGGGALERLRFPLGCACERCQPFRVESGR